MFCCFVCVVAHLAVGVHHRPQQLPGPAPPVHPDHAEDLQEAQTPQDGGGEDVPLAAGRDHRHGRNQDDDVCRRDDVNTRSKS